MGVSESQIHHRSRGSRSRIKPRVSMALRNIGTGEVLLSLLLLAIPVGLLGYFGHTQIEGALKAQLRANLQATVASAASDLERWLDVCRRSHQAAVSDGQIRRAAQCLAHGHDASCVTSLYASAAPYSAQTGGRVFVVTGLGRVWTAPDNSVPLTPDEERALHQRLTTSPPAAGELTFLTPFRLGERQTTSGFLSRLSGPHGPQLLLTEVPVPSLSETLVAARGGDTAETYAVDSHGWMITQSRFLEHLRFARLLGPKDESSVLALQVRDPGVNLVEGERTGVVHAAQPLTLMARELTAGRTGLSVDGYRDYRGVPVVGAWRWLADYGLGITTEMDQTEAFGAMSQLRLLFFAQLGLLVVLCFTTAGVALVALRFRHRASLALSSNRRLGQYVVERKLGKGGMGTVYLATHATLKRPTAIKVVNSLDTGPDAASRFEREARVTSELVHPNTISVYDYGVTEDGTFYYAMEYLEGLDVDELVTRYGALPEQRVVHFLIQACGSLQEAHERELVHRDIKPSNLFVCRESARRDLLKVLDFGIVKAGAGSTQLTQASAIVGTAEYMAPEMFDRRSGVGPASDIYSLGAVAYFMLTGTPVFDATTLAEFCTAHLSETPIPPSERSSEPISSSLERIVLACLAKTPSARPAGAAELGSALRRLECAHRWSPENAADFWKEVPGQTPRPARTARRSDGELSTAGR